MTDPDEGFRKAINSTAAQAVSRFVMPILVTLVGATGTTVLWMGWSTLQDVRMALKDSSTQMWIALGKVSDSQIKDESLLQKQLDISTQLFDLTRDHETRIRVLEHPPH